MKCARWRSRSTSRRGSRSRCSREEALRCSGGDRLPRAGAASRLCRTRRQRRPCSSIARSCASSTTIASCATRRRRRAIPARDLRADLRRALEDPPGRAGSTHAALGGRSGLRRVRQRQRPHAAGDRLSRIVGGELWPAEQRRGLPGHAPCRHPRSPCRRARTSSGGRWASPMCCCRSRASRIVDPKLKSDRWLRGPGVQARRPPHRARGDLSRIQESGQWIGTWTPWYGFVSFPQGLALRLPAGSHVVADADQGSVALYYAEKPIRASDLESRTRAETGALCDPKARRHDQALPKTRVCWPWSRPFGAASSPSRCLRELPSGATQSAAVREEHSARLADALRLPASRCRCPKARRLTVVEHYATDVASAP